MRFGVGGVVGFGVEGVDLALDCEFGDGEFDIEFVENKKYFIDILLW